MKEIRIFLKARKFYPTMFVMYAVVIKKLVFWRNKCASIACPYCVHFLIFSYNMHNGNTGV